MREKGPAAAEFGDGVSLPELIALAVKSKTRIAAFATLGAIIGVGSTFLTPTAYTSASSFTPQSRSTPSSIGGLAAQLGVPISTQPSETPQFYADLVRTNELLRRTAIANYGDSANPTTLAQLAGISAPDSARLLWETSRWLSRRVFAVTLNRTGVVSLRTTAPDAALAQKINAHVLDLVNRFNLETRQSQASAERKFAERRMAELRAELQTAEDAYQTFLEQNRAGLTAPELAFRRGRHEREVALRQQVYATVVEAHETAKLDEVRDTPVITIVDPPRVPLTPDSKHRSLRGVLGIIVGGGIGLAVVLVMATTRMADGGRDVVSVSPTEAK